MPLLGSQENFKYSILSWVQLTLLSQQYKSVKFSQQMEYMAHNKINLIHKLYPRVRNLHCSMKGQRIYHEERIVDCVIGNLRNFVSNFMNGRLLLVNCPTRWSLYCPLGICIDHLFHNPYLKWNIVHQCTRVLCYTVPGKFIRELIRLILTSANWLQSLLGSHTIRATRRSMHKWPDHDQATKMPPRNWFSCLKI